MRRIVRHTACHQQPAAATRELGAASLTGCGAWVCCLPRRPSRSVVLSVRGSNSMEDLLTDMMDRPLDITAWLPDDFKQASGGQLAQAWA